MTRLHGWAFAALLALLSALPAHADALAKIDAAQLAATRQAVADLKKEWQAVPRMGPFREYRANLHVHSAFSHDSRGKIEEIVAAAKKVGTRVLMFTEHPADHYDFFRDGHQGTKDGVLLIPGAESQGFLVFPRQSLKGVPAGKPQAYSDFVRGRGGLMFVAHLEERMDWEIKGVTGVEIYNIHADFKDEKAMIKALSNPLWIVKTGALIRQYPQEVFSALQDYPTDYLRRWDQLCQKAPHTGVSANDAHQNVGLVARLAEGNKVRLEDALGVRRGEVPAAALTAFGLSTSDKKSGDELLRFQLDPYECSLRHVGTHLLLRDLTQQEVWEALEAGRAFVAFDWIADSTGFDCAACAGPLRWEMGSRPAYASGIRLQARSPLPVHWRVLRNGQEVTTAAGRQLDWPVPSSGNYRVEAWLNVAGQKMIWILTNPFYIGAEVKKGS